jgi:hypothetical protein
MITERRRRGRPRERVHAGGNGHGRSIQRGAPLLNVDSPDPAAGEVLATPLEVWGWTWSSSSIHRVVVEVDGEREFEAFTGLRRPDVADEIGAPEVVNPGFTCPLGTDVLPPGVHRLRVVATARDGRSATWSTEIRTRRWADEPAGQPLSPSDSPHPAIAPPSQNGNGVDPLFERLVEVESELALAHYALSEAQMQAEYAARRAWFNDPALAQLAEERRLRAEILSSTSWRVTRPLRAAGRVLRRVRAAAGRR